MNQNDTILVVEDEPAIAESVEYALRKSGFAACVATDLASARRLHPNVALMILDLMLPDGNGKQLIEELRAQGRSTPIIVLSSRDSEEDRVGALEAGADDYVTKPFSPREVVARVRAVLRRLGAAENSVAPSVARLGQPGLSQDADAVAPTAAHATAAVALCLLIDRETRRARLGPDELELTRVEFELLAELATHPGKVFARSELIDRVWGNGFAITDRTVDSHVKSLRRKVLATGTSAPLIETVRGVGYRLSESAQA